MIRKIKSFVMSSIVWCLVLAVAGYAFAKMDNNVDNPVSDIKKKIMQIAGKASSGSDSVTISVGNAGHLLGGQVMIAVSQIVKNEKIGNGAAFSVALPHKTFTARVKAGRRFRVQVNQESYYLDFKSVSDSSATFQIVKGGKTDDDES